MAKYLFCFVYHSMFEMHVEEARQERRRRKKKKDTFKKEEERVGEDEES